MHSSTCSVTEYFRSLSWIIVSEVKGFSQVLINLVYIWLVPARRLWSVVYLSHLTLQPSYSEHNFPSRWIHLPLVLYRYRPPPAQWNSVKWFHLKNSIFSRCSITLLFFFYRATGLQGYPCLTGSGETLVGSDKWRLFGPSKHFKLKWWSWWSVMSAKMLTLSESEQFLVSSP